MLHRVLEGLAEAHRQGMVHGSVSPRTIVVDLDGTPKLVVSAQWILLAEDCALDGG